MNAPGQDGSSGGQGDARDHGLPEIDVVIPDDISELDAEVRAYRREVRRNARRTALRRVWWGVPGGRVRLVSLPLVISLLLPAVLVIVTMMVMLPQTLRQAPQEMPLATPNTAPGSTGGLLPRGDISLGGEPITLRNLRPAVIVLVPSSCGCVSLLSRIDDQATNEGVPVYLISASGAKKQLGELVGDFGDTASVGTDSNHRLSVYRPAGVTAVLVRSDGVVAAIDRDLPANPSLDKVLATLNAPSAS